MPSPLRNRAARNCSKVRGTAERTPETAYRSAQRKSIFFRPKRSLEEPGDIAPGMQPRIALAPAIPSWVGSRPMCALRYEMAPLITAVS